MDAQRNALEIKKPVKRSHCILYIYIYKNYHSFDFFRLYVLETKLERNIFHFIQAIFILCH